MDLYLDEDLLGERAEAELGAARRQRLDDPAHVVADQAESRRSAQGVTFDSDRYLTFSKTFHYPE